MVASFFEPQLYPPRFRPPPEYRHAAIPQSLFAQNGRGDGPEGPGKCLRTGLNGQANLPGRTWDLPALNCEGAPKRGNSIINLIGPNAQIVASHNGQGLYAVYREVIPLPAETTVAGLGLLGVAGIRIARRRD